MALDMSAVKALADRVDALNDRADCVMGDEAVADIATRTWVVTIKGPGVDKYQQVQAATASEAINKVKSEPQYKKSDLKFDAYLR